MAIASVGTLGTGVSSTASTSYTLTTATNSLASGNFGILTSTTDNIATADGNTNTHTSVTGGTGTWTKLGEYTNTVGGAAGDGTCTSLWLFEATGTNGTGTVMTMNLSANATDKAASFWKFTKAGGQSIRLDPDAATNPVTNGTDASNGFGSVAFSGLPSQARLYFRGLGKEANSTTNITPSGSFTAITAARSRNNAAAQIVRGEFRINTSTGETSNPTLAVVGDTAGVFAALEEYTPAVTHTTSGALTGQGAATAGTAAHITLHGTSGALTGQGATTAGTATHNQPHATSGALVGGGTTLSGTATHNVAHSTSGALTGQGATTAGAALRQRIHGTSGVLAGQGATTAGTAVHSAAAVHDTSGALAGQAQGLAGVAAVQGATPAGEPATGGWGPAQRRKRERDRLKDDLLEVIASMTTVRQRPAVQRAVTQVVETLPEQPATLDIQQAVAALDNLDYSVKTIVQRAAQQLQYRARQRRLREDEELLLF